MTIFTIVTFASLLVLIVGLFKIFETLEYPASIGRKLSLFLMVVIPIFFIVTAFYITRDQSKGPIIFSERMVMDSLWEFYKRDFIEDESGRTIDHNRDGISTSEGQSYTMLRAVWMGDKETFDKSWRWAKDILYREEDRLFAWLFGPRPDGTYGVRRDIGGYNTASDADVDIALALLLAYSRWQEDSYYYSAGDVIRDIWEKEVVMIAGKPYLAANNIEKGLNSETILVNPSYLAPYAYRIFAKVDPNPAHDWDALVDSSYEILEASIESPLDKSRGELPADWVEVNRTTGEILPPNPNRNMKTTYGYEALRIPWRLALDWQWSRDQRAKEVLSKMDYLEKEWSDKGRLASVYAHDGRVENNSESAAMYGGSLGYFIVMDPKKAEEIYRDKLLDLYNPDTNNWRKDAGIGYYEANMAWFGMALYKNMLLNFTTS